ncbi:helix-turn-helix transcriptional regulator [Aneurinibacillus aneurinilyticus]|uniref:helix-turn-helix transcriptional regulator n=1 Tax=Aneurinibacillus aneurinilyticus TaxID=1391 RepID=UPI002E251358|nr:helix-turn-helix transcriptional regulator [Aneurinibacillus aneurinilyticus]
MVKHRRDKMVSLRKEKGWLQKDVVDLLKNNYGIVITESYYGMIEQGVRTPKLNIALAIAELFEVNPNEIFFESNNNKKLGNKTA